MRAFSSDGCASERGDERFGRGWRREQLLEVEGDVDAEARVLERRERTRLRETAVVEVRLKTANHGGEVLQSRCKVVGLE
jgi:hypothetical protein